MTEKEKKALIKAGYNEGGLGDYMFKSKFYHLPEEWVFARSKVPDETTIFVDEATLEVSFEGSDKFQKELLDEYEHLILGK